MAESTRQALAPACCQNAPVVSANLGNISYVLCAAAGAVMALTGSFGLTLGTLVSYLTLNKNFSQPVTQISQQLNNIVMAMAGANRVFRLMDEEPETDSGYVELVSAKMKEDGTLAESRSFGRVLTR